MWYGLAAPCDAHDKWEEGVTYGEKNMELKESKYKQFGEQKGWQIAELKDRRRRRGENQGKALQRWEQEKEREDLITVIIWNL